MIRAEFGSNWASGISCTTENICFWKVQDFLSVPAVQKHFAVWCKKSGVYPSEGEPGKLEIYAVNFLWNFKFWHVFFHCTRHSQPVSTVQQYSIPPQLVMAHTKFGWDWPNGISCRRRNVNIGRDAERPSRALRGTRVRTSSAETLKRGKCLSTGIWENGYSGSCARRLHSIRTSFGPQPPHRRQNFLCSEFPASLIERSRL